MPVYVFFKKDYHIHVIEKNNNQESQSLIDQGFQRQFEEIQSSSPKKALARFLDIRKDESTLEYAFYYGSILEGMGVLGNFPKTH